MKGNKVTTVTKFDTQLKQIKLEFESEYEWIKFDDIVGGFVMLTDLERKVLQILYNFSHSKRRMPTIPELEIKTGKDDKTVRSVLNGLGYIY
ncbi:hypothetical protein VQL36_13395 [Chengkuizengella sp. SCS-71B]|uniref:hypothetical protein n=1 Tax=Chengkuizengella sp. SCS-71B TaxID=3115290 RepID=UPI0032C21D8B